jgi:1-acyl-sn-glycerol-3-phosphate acyltransferase
MKKALQILFSIYGCILFIALLLLLLPAFAITSLFGPLKGGNLMYRICSFWADCWLFLIGIRSKIIHEKGDQETRPCIFVANHGSYMDIPMLVKSIREPIRVLGKQEMSTIPVFGYVYRRAVVMVNRKDPEQRAASVKALKEALTNGVSIVIFPEGTFNMGTTPLKEFYDGAFRIALETNTPIQPVIFPDSVKRLAPDSVFSLSPGMSRAVYLPMVPVEHLGEQDLASLRQTVYQLMESALLRYQSK